MPETYHYITAFKFSAIFFPYSVLILLTLVQFHLTLIFKDWSLHMQYAQCPELPQHQNQVKRKLLQIPVLLGITVSWHSCGCSFNAHPNCRPSRSPISQPVAPPPHEQDNMAIYTAKTALEQLKDQTQALTWPPDSQDPNPIKDPWDVEEQARCMDASTP